MANGDTNGNPRIQFRLHHVLSLLSVAFIGLLALLYNEVRTLEGRINDIQAQEGQQEGRIYLVMFKAILDPAPLSPNRVSLQNILRSGTDPSEALVSSNKACMDACREAVVKKYGHYSESHEQWCRQSCSSASLGRPADIWRAAREEGKQFWYENLPAPSGGISRLDSETRGG